MSQRLFTSASDVLVRSAHAALSRTTHHGRRIRKNAAALPWAKQPARELVRLSWPIAVSMLSYSAMTLVDTVFVAHLGPSSLAGVGLGGTIAFVMLAFPFGVFRGAKTLLAQAIGAGAADRERLLTAATVAICLVIGVLSLFGGLAAAAAMPWLTPEADTAHVAGLYLSIRALAAPAALLFAALREVRYARGDSVTPMHASVGANVLNIVLCAVFAWGFSWGVAGVAWATVISTFAQAMPLLVGELRRGLSLRAARRAEVRDVLITGAPTGAQFLLETGSFSLLTILLAGMPATELGAHQIALQVLLFGFLPCLAVSEAVSVLVGQAIGARRVALVSVVCFWGLVVVGVYAAAAAVVYLVGDDLIVAGFTSDPGLARRAGQLLIIAAAFSVVDAAGAVARGALRGTGDVGTPALIAVATAWLCTPPLTWLLGVSLGWGAVGGWIGLLCEIFLQAGILWWRLVKGGWVSAARGTRRRAERATPVVLPAAVPAA